MAIISVDQWTLFLPAAVLVAASPGAGNFLALTNGVRSGFGAAVAALLGRFAAFAILIALVIIGFGAIVATSEMAFAIVKWFGVAYLVYIGFRLWISPGLPQEVRSRTSPSLLSAELPVREFFVAISNPKALLLFTAFLPQFVDPTRPLAGQFVVLGAAYCAAEFVAASCYALVGSQIRGIRLGPRGARWVNRTSGGMMIIAAAWLATARRTS